MGLRSIGRLSIWPGTAPNSFAAAVLTAGSAGRLWTLPGNSSFGVAIPAVLWAVSFGRARSRLGRLFLPVFFRPFGFERAQQFGGDRRDPVYRGLESGFIALRRLVESGDFPRELERSGPNLRIADRRIEIKQGPDAAAHTLSITSGRCPAASWLLSGEDFR